MLTRRANTFVKDDTMVGEMREMSDGQKLPQCQRTESNVHVCSLGQVSFGGRKDLAKTSDEALDHR